MDEPDDIEVLRRFVEDDSEGAFATLVRRHIDLVYSAALRQTRNPHAAEEVTQAVFIILSRKAKSLLRVGTLAGWLYQAARLTSANYLRAESRRTHREQEAYMQSMMNEPTPNAEEVWTQCAPLLESAMGELNARDRTAILLRYFQNKSLRDVGLLLGVNEDAARMRVSRGLERLRRFFTRRGVSLSAVAIAGAIGANSVQAAPGNLAVNVTAGVAKGAALGGSVAALVKGTLWLLAWARYKLLVGLSASAIVAAGIITSVFLSESKAHPQAAGNTALLAGGLTDVGPFQGTSSEGFDHLGITGAQQKISVLGRTATVSNLTHGGALKLEFSSSLDGVLVRPRSAPLMLGQLGISEWVFNPPLVRFGGYFQNNSRFDDASVDFYDANDMLIGSETAKVPKSFRGWTWNGWQSTVPVHRLVITGNDAEFLHGFIWFDDVQVTTAPPLPCTITCPGNITACSDPGQCGATIEYPAPLATHCAGLAIACVPPAGSFFPMGTHPVLCAAMDAAGHVTNACSFEVTVRDCEPPVIHSVAASPDLLWPPDHRMVEVTVSVSVEDNCHVAGCRITSVTSSEPTIAQGSGRTAPDWQVTGDLTVSLRAERSGGAIGRVYSITVECTDDAGNPSTAAVQIAVPHDLRFKVKGQLTGKSALDIEQRWEQ
jgi:RNA polymerase sigma factor (sigma-70 family)